MYNKFKKTMIMRLAALGLLFSLLLGCGGPDDIFTVGIAYWDIPNSQYHLQGFKDVMANMNYVEDQDIEYIYEAIPEDKMFDAQFIDSKLENILARDPDILLAVGQAAIERAKALTQENDIPVLFSGTAWPIESGFVDSLAHPGGNLTGVMSSNCVPKALEWLVSIAGAEKIYLPYNPDDDPSIEILKDLDVVKERLVVELALQEIYSVEEAVAAIENLPDDIDAVFRIPSPTLDLRNSELSQASIKRGLPMCAPLKLDDAVLATFANDEYNMGEKLGRLAQQIIKGIKPSDLPVETADVSLTINLKTAEQIGLDLPDEILAQAKRIIR
jgi:putative ABC transport system substrate-binding protein